MSVYVLSFECIYVSIMRGQYVRVCMHVCVCVLVCGSMFAGMPTSACVCVRE